MYRLYRRCQASVNKLGQFGDSCCQSCLRVVCCLFVSPWGLGRRGSLFRGGDPSPTWQMLAHARARAPALHSAVAVDRCGCHAVADCCLVRLLLSCSLLLLLLLLPSVLQDLRVHFSAIRRQLHKFHGRVPAAAYTQHSINCCFVESNPICVCVVAGFCCVCVRAWGAYSA